MFSKLQGKKIKVCFNGEIKAHIIRQYNFTQLLEFLQDSFEVPQNNIIELRCTDSSGDSIVVGSEEEFISTVGAGILKYELVAKEYKPPVPVIEQMSKLEKSLPIELKVEAAVQTSPVGKVRHRLNPLFLKRLFDKFMTTEACAVEIEDLVKTNRKTLLSQKHTLENYADTIKEIENLLQDALENNVFLVDIGSDDEVISEKAPERQSNDLKEKEKVGSTDLDNIPVEQSVIGLRQ
eukprot:TRINITY_DN700_c0_g1_i1.p2 TRINITY_DN700_c0_g1~~TRINITY_DN700_c0_g1_i1.p2  ORF type:complete len:261 (+),score=33.30 TRINITY_DN700_c0_g1_i1:78-785(+)